MAIQDHKITTYADNVKAMPDYPSQDGITAEQLKAAFDGRTDKEVKTKHNGLVDDVDIINARTISHEANKGNPHAVTKAQVGLGNVTNTSDANKPLSTQQKSYVDSQIEAVQNSIGAEFEPAITGAASTVAQSNVTANRVLVSTAGGKIAASADVTITDLNNIRFSAGNFQEQLYDKADLDQSGKVLASQLPSYVDDVLEFGSIAQFPEPGETGKIYIAIDTNLQYRWTGSAYVGISSNLALGETAQSAYRGDRGRAAFDHSNATGNPHNMTKADIGLSNVDNTSDMNKPVSYLVGSALNEKRDLLDSVFHKPILVEEGDGYARLKHDRLRFDSSVDPGVVDIVVPIDGNPPYLSGDISGEFYGEFNEPKSRPVITLSSPTWDFVLSDKAKITIATDTALTIDGIYSGAVGLIYVYGGHELILPSNSSTTKDFDYVTVGTGEFYEYMFVFDGTTYHWSRTVRGE